MGGYRGLIREPLLHFLIAGTLLFAAYAWMNPASPSSTDGPVKIGPGQISWLRETFSAQWRREPTSAELKELVDALVREQLLAREAVALGLDQDDTVVRRRLAQKLTFLVDDTIRLAEPDEAELRTYLAKHPGKYSTETKLSFQQVFYSPKRRADPSADAKAVLAGLVRSQTALPDGDPLPLEAVYTNVDQAAVSSLFGPAFAQSLSGMQQGTWSGPVTSAFGVHLVIVSDRSEGGPRPFEDVRQILIDDWKRQKVEEANAAFLEKLRDKYGVAIDEGVTDAKAAPANVSALP